MSALCPSTRLLPLGLLLLLGLLLAAPPARAAAAASSDAPLQRSPRLFFGLFGGPRCGACPLHHCSIDPAIVHGYCCGCAKLFDRVPIQCPPQLTCPLHSEPLCSDYNYMMDCCC